MKTFRKKFQFPVVTGLLALISACGSSTESYVYKEGVSVSRADNDYFECELAAARGVPQDARVGTTPTYTTPTRTTCYNIGNSVQCNTTGGQTSGGQTYSYDANSDLRAKFFSKCMAARGYSIVDLPKCDQSKISDEMFTKLSNNQRRPTEGACYVPVTESTGNVVYPSEL